MTMSEPTHHDPADEYGLHAWVSHVSNLPPALRPDPCPIFLRTDQILGVAAPNGWLSGPTTFYMVGGSTITVNGQGHYWQKALQLAILLREQRLKRSEP